MNSVQWVGFYTLLRRECYRFLSIPRQTVGGPLLETFLYISVFGAALGSRISEIGGVSYVVFIIPGLLLMSMIINCYANNSSSLAQQKMLRSIDDQLASPVSNYSLLAAYTLGGFLRASLIVVIAFATASLMVQLPMANAWIFVSGLVFSGLFFASLGVLAGLIGQTNEQISSYQTFILQPLIFLGGVFYSVALLPEPFKTLTHLDPIFYMINTVRFGMIGHSDVNPYWSLLAIIAFTIAITAVNARLFKRGYKLRT
ncbi:ABC transporter permease [Candidatus Saccharibacteria bacterium]|nr:ABC transporter permease [Candidatus Saccharibacteria bacterium]